MRKVSIILAVLAIALMIAGASAVAVPGQSTTPEESLPYNLDKAANITEPDTVVVVVANPEDYNVIAIADVVANHIGAPVLLTPPDELSIYVVETISQMLAHGNVTKAIVIGTDENTTAIADLIRDINDPITGKNLELVNVIYAETPEDLSNKATIYEWDSASAIIVADGYVQADVAKAVMMSAIDDIPVIFEQVGNTTIETTADLLGATTIYVTPAVDPDIISALDDSFTVNSTWHNISTITDSLEEFILDAQSAKNATFVVVKESDIRPYDGFLYVMGVYNLANVSVVVAVNSTALGANQTDFLTDTNPSMVILVGNITVASETLSNTIAAATGKVPWRLVYDSPIEEITEFAIAASNYYYPIVVTNYEQLNNTFTYYFKNIGFSDVVKFDTYSLRVTFTKASGSFIDSNPIPVAQNETRVVYEFKDPIYPHDYVVLTFSVTEGTNFTVIPKLEYYGYTLAGTVKPLTSFFDYVVSYFEKAKSWIFDMFQKLVGILSVYIPLPNYVVMAIAAFLTFVILWSIVGFIVYIIVLLVGKRPENPALYGVIVWVIEKVRGR